MNTKPYLQNLISVSEASQDFSRLTRLVDENGTVVISQNDSPRYILMEYALVEHTIVSDDEVEKVADAVLDEYLDAFMEMAKND